MKFYWNSPHGKLLKSYIDSLPHRRRYYVWVFGKRFGQGVGFVAPLSWAWRAREEIIGDVTLQIAAEIDVLVDHIAMSEEKILLRFLAEIQDEPSEDDLLKSLRSVLDIYRPLFEGEIRHCDTFSNTRLAWRSLYGRDIDIWEKIIRPSIRELEKARGLPPKSSRL